MKTQRWAGARSHEARVTNIVEAVYFGERYDQICLLKKSLCLVIMVGQMKHLLNS